MRLSRGQRLAVAAWALAGAISAYLTIQHYTGTDLACPQTGAVNCAEVTTSTYAYLFGIPVAVLGLIYQMVGLLLALLLRGKAGYLVGTVFTGIGLGFVFYLIWAEVQVQALCSWCTAIHLLVAGLFVYYFSVWFSHRR